MACPMSYTRGHSCCQMKSDNERIAAVLHDVVEDIQWTLDDLAANGFNPEILDAIDVVHSKHPLDALCQIHFSPWRVLAFPY